METSLKILAENAQQGNKNAQQGNKNAQQGNKNALETLLKQI